MDLGDQNEVRKIVEGCAKGDQDYQRLLYKTLYSSMMSVCYRYAKRPEEAKDLFQEGFIKVFDKIGKYNFKGSLQGWVRRIMVNNAIDHYRREKNKYAFSETLVEAENIPAEEESEGLYEDISARDLLNMVQELSTAYRTVFNLFIMENYTHAEIAEMLNISEGTSKSNLAKAKRNLKKMVLEKLKTSKA